MLSEQIKLVGERHGASRIWQFCAKEYGVKEGSSPEERQTQAFDVGDARLPNAVGRVHCAIVVRRLIFHPIDQRRDGC